MFLEYTFQWRVVWKHWPELVQAGILTLQITILSIILGLLIAAILAALQDSKNPFARGIAATWIALARNTPALLQIYMAYFGLGAFGIHLSPYTAVLGAITFNNAGYLTEILRGGFQFDPDIAKICRPRARFIQNSGLCVRSSAASLANSIPAHCESGNLGNAGNFARNGYRTAGVNGHDDISSVADISTL